MEIFPRPSISTMLKGGLFPGVFALSPGQRDSPFGATALIPEAGFPAPQKSSAIDIEPLTLTLSHSSASPRSRLQPFGGGDFPLKFSISPGEDFSLVVLFQPKCDTLSGVFMSTLEEGLSLRHHISAKHLGDFPWVLYFSPGEDASFGAVTQCWELCFSLGALSKP